MPSTRLSMAALILATIPSCVHGVTIINGRAFGTENEKMAGVTTVPSERALNEEVEGIKPLADIRVRLSQDVSVLSDRHGNFAWGVEFAWGGLFPLAVSVSASKPGYEELSKEVRLMPVGGEALRVVLLRKNTRREH